MHHCFRIPELRQQIFSAVYSSDEEDSLRRRHDSIFLQWPNPIDSSSRQTLATLARTCRVFSEPALDILWARLDSLEPLVFCFPDNIWSVSDEGVIDLKAPILAVAWHKFQRHARRVRVLGSDSPLFGSNLPLFGKMSKDFIIALGCFPSREGLLPNLRELYWHNLRDDDLDPFMRYFLTPTLRSIRIYSDTCTIAQCSVVSSIATICHELEIFEYYPASDAPTDVDVLDAISEYGWVSMGTLRALKITSSFRMSNFYFPKNLNSLSVEFIPDGWNNFGPQCVETLQNLKLRSPELWPCIRFIQKLHAPFLRKLIVECEFHSPSASRGELFTSLQSKFSCSTMESITVKVAKPHTGNSGEYPCTMQTIRPLLSFSLLKELHLDPLNMSHIDDIDIQEIASSLPNIEWLILGTRYFWEETPKLTLNGVNVLLARCPRLRTLGLVIDATVLDPVTQEKLGGGVPNITITTLYVGCSKIHDPTKVAVILSGILPSLRRIVVELYPNRHREARQAKWKEVAEHLQSFAKIRGQGRQKNGVEL
ncbi:hypothetical protein BV22DRAFT_1045789 [Leucogyrophana mollusca]|uniref:Uncharacterized protein n=1 Tax=Leucogyrophana mollusca TaxID=85980 RepID=A0ACB8BMW2_9AGAM|nr:hypothetical protein BV22DRAFT_1045789 [Leucogyrophana mollusca]